MSRAEQSSVLLALAYSLCSQARDLKKLHCFILKTLDLAGDTFLSNNLITSYSNRSLLVYARNLFDQILHPNPFSWNGLLSAYSKAGHIPQMEQVFSSMPSRDLVSWNALVSGYIGRGCCERAFNAYRALLLEGRVAANRITFSSLLIIASKCSDFNLGRQVHCHILKFGFASHVFVGSPLVDMYSKAGFVHEAKRVFEDIEEKNVVLYNIMLAGLLRSGMVEDSKKLFDEMEEKDSISWTTMVTGLTQNGLEQQAVDLSRAMRAEGVCMDQFTFGSILTACGGLSALELGKQTHAFIIRTRYDENVFAGSALVDMYSKCRHIKSAELVFQRMKTKNVVSWTSMLVGYGQNGCSEEAVRTYCEMQKQGIEPDDFTLGSVISSCANLASLEEGAQLHCKANISGLISFITVSNAIVTLYGKCGIIEDSHKLFNEMRSRDSVSWTALVSGYAQFGKANETMDLFERMLNEGVMPDGITFIGVLSACSRAGLVEKGYRYYNSMIHDHHIVPTADHYTCMIDLLSRSGRLKEAEDFINQMPCHPDAIAWATLLSSCRFRNELEIGKWAAENLLELEPQNPASYVLLSSLHAARGNWDEVAHLRKGMRDKNVRKEPGCSWIKYKNKVHIFSADDQSHPYSERIYAELEKLSSKMIAEGYKPDVSSVLHDVTESAKIHLLSHHSEKLAIAFGLIFIPPELPIRVVKNLRVCMDCHNATKFISKISNREILVRDSIRFHKFSGGACSCGDFW
ncbi:hypothetical protein ZIOFF_061830 [Zingiber officinale]|uniref:DYW domain-containing protein n=1 Tax=Zingiber officinale TaxID=94328 RepID=A0A8J5F4R7_ZINOF|nr:hypothetical protein ZIOFF_061830 [Zingiber officinale]